MPNPFVKLWKYLTASANAQIDQRADPKIQIAQAIEAEQQRHQALANQAAAVLGNQRQLEQAKMQEHVAASMRQVNELSAPGNTPSLAEVRDKIEARYANALGQAELAQSSVEGRMLEVQKATLDVAGASRLDQIRASMGGGTQAISGNQAAGAIESGTTQAAGNGVGAETP